jgi:hypothetical protein
MQKKQFLGTNTENLITTARNNGGKAKNTTFKNGTQVKTIAKTCNDDVEITKQTSFAHAGKEGILADEHIKV